ncbi:MAG: hypothetical protein JWM33_849 [Caulobacteraceae bacterium]|nr:hypothetical protein [Caulobacteraceae bacterium]
MSQSVLAQITPLMRDLFDEYLGPITLQTTAEDIPQWDSLAHIQLIVLVEKLAGIRFSTLEIERFRRLGDLVEMVDRKQGNG